MASPPVPPRLHVSTLPDDVGNTPNPKPRCAAGASPLRGPYLASSSDWIDVDDSPPRSGKRPSKTSTAHSSRRQRDRPSPQIDRKDSDLSRYFPRLSRILEGTESTSSAKTGSPRTSDHRRPRERSSPGRPHHRDESRSSVQRRPIRRRTSAVPSRRVDSLHSANPSLLSVLTSLTASSERSSGSGSTITQSSYDRRDSGRSRTPKARPRSASTKPVDMASSISSPGALNVFDYMVKADEMHDDRSIRSTSSSFSQYAPSDADSSDDPATPSSRSSMPSPTATRNGSIGELSQKYDFQSVVSSSSVRSNSRSPDDSSRRVHRKRSMSDVAEECDDDDEDDDDEDEDEDEDNDRNASVAPSAIPAHVSQAARRSSSQSSQRSSSGSLHHDGMRRQDKRYAMHTPDSGRSVGPPYGQPRSQSSSSTGSGRDAYAVWETAMQQYQYPSPAPTPPSSILPVPSPGPQQNGHVSSLPARPPVPDAPDLSQRTLTGYEQLALEIASTASPVQPIYRKFEYLNHRILLHLQDELSELEEQLRIIDEIIAQLEPSSTDISAQRSSSSRRGDTYSGAEIHHRRTSLLGRIFLKTEQYSRAMKAYAEMSRDSLPADPAQVDQYRAWLTKHSPVHELETRFLNQSPDLIIPGATRGLMSPAHFATGPSDMSKWQACCTILPFALMLPVLLFAAIPSAIGRLLVVSLIAIGVFIVAATNPRLRSLVSVRDWAVASGLYVLVMAAVAGCVPGRA